MTQPTGLIVTNTPVKQQPHLRDSLMALLTWIAADAVAGIVIFITMVAVMRQHEGKSPAEIVALLPTDFTFLTATTTATAVVALLVLWRYAKHSELKSLAAFFPAVPRQAVVWAAISGVAVMMIEVALENGIKSGLGIGLPVSAEENAINPKSWSQLFIVIATLALVVPLFEEVIFRGYIFGWLKRVIPLWLAIVISAAAFAAVHGLYAVRGGFSGWFGTAEIFAIGVLLAWWVNRTGSLIPAYIIHMIINTVSFALGFLLPGFYP